MRSYLRAIRNRWGIASAFLGFLFLLGGVGPDEFASNIAAWCGLTRYSPTPSTATIQSTMAVMGLSLLVVGTVVAYVPRAAARILKSYDPTTLFSESVDRAISFVKLDLSNPQATVTALTEHGSTLATWREYKDIERLLDESSDAVGATGSLVMAGILETQLRDIVRPITVSVTRTAPPPIEVNDSGRTHFNAVVSTFTLSRTYIDHQVVAEHEAVEYARLTDVGREVVKRLRKSIVPYE